MNTISPLYINLLLTTTILSFVIPIILCIVCYKKFGGNLKYLCIGILIAILARYLVGNAITKGVNQSLTADISNGKLIAISIITNIIILIIAFVFKWFVFSRSKKRRDIDPDRYRFDDAPSVGYKGSTFQFAIGFAAVIGVVYCGLTAFNNYTLALMINQGLVESFITQSYATAADQAAARVLIENFANSGISTFITPLLSLIAVIAFEIGNTLKAYCAGYKRDNAFTAILAAIVTSFLFIIPSALASGKIIESEFIYHIIQLAVGLLTLVIGLILYKRGKEVDEDMEYGGRY